MKFQNVQMVSMWGDLGGKPFPAYLLSLSAYLGTLGIRVELSQWSDFDWQGTAHDLVVLDLSPALAKHVERNFFLSTDDRRLFLVGDVAVSGDIAGFKMHAGCVEAFHFDSFDYNRFADTIAHECNRSALRINRQPTQQFVNWASIYPERIPVEGITRGCEHKCLFCFLNNSKKASGIVRDKNQLTFFELKNLNLISREDLYLQFIDENFIGSLQSPARADQLERFLAEIKGLKKNVRFGIDTRIESVAEAVIGNQCFNEGMNVIKKLKAAGLDYVFLGAETFSRSQAKRYGKSISQKKIIDTIRVLKDTDLKFTLGMIVNDPLLTREEFFETIEFIENYDLWGNCASISKPMRFTENGKYLKLLLRHGFEFKASGNFFHREICGSSESNFERISELSDILRGSGYRSGDVVRYAKSAKEYRTLMELNGFMCRMEADAIQKLFLDVEEWAVTKHKFCTGISNELERFQDGGNLKFFDDGTILPSVLNRLRLHVSQYSSCGVVSRGQEGN